MFAMQTHGLLNVKAHAKVLKYIINYNRYSDPWAHLTKSR